MRFSDQDNTRANSTRVPNAPWCKEHCGALTRTKGVDVRGSEYLRRLFLDVDIALTPKRTSLVEPYRLTLQTDGEISISCDRNLLFFILLQFIGQSATRTLGNPEAQIDVFVTQHSESLYLQIADNGQPLSGPESEWLEGCASADVGHTLRFGSLLVKVAGGSCRLLHTGRDGTRIGLSLPCNAKLRAECNGVANCRNYQRFLENCTVP